MKLDEQLWREHQYAVLVSFIHHIAYWRASSQALAKAGRHSEMWTRSTDAHLLRAVIDWCMVFGTDSNEIHWKKVVLDGAAQDGFRHALLDRLAISRDAWGAYRSQMTRFRNDYAAHRTPASSYPTVPRMETALQIAIAYDEWFRQALSALPVPVLGLDEPFLAERYARLMRTSEAPMAAMIAYAPSVDEEYEGHPPRNP